MSSTATRIVVISSGQGIIWVNTRTVSSTVYMFADDTKMYNRICDINDHRQLQSKWILTSWTHGLRIGV